MAPQYATYPSLKDKVVLVTGGAEGIGGSTISAFAAQGSKTIILDISQPSAEKLIEEIRSAGYVVPEFYQCDVTDLKALKSIVDEILSKYGKVDVLVNNAASAGGLARKSTEEVDEESWDFNVNVNLRHQFFLTKWLVPAMQKQGGGSVVNMGSISWRIPSVGCECLSHSSVSLRMKMEYVLIRDGSACLCGLQSGCCRSHKDSCEGVWKGRNPSE